jgi:DNA-binding transcriptional ArsR family regulator
MGANEPADFNADRAELFEALGHPTRIRILEALDEGSLGFSEIKRKVGLESNGLLSFHLGKLDGLVRLTQNGSYAITDEGREALRVVSTTSVRGERGGGSGTISQSHSGPESSGAPTEAAFYRQRRYQAALVVIVTLLLVGVAALYLSATAQYTDVTADFSVEGNWVSFNAYSTAHISVQSLDIWVNGSHAVSSPGTFSYLYYRLPDGFAVTTGGTYNVTVVLSYTDGTTLVKSTMLKGLARTTFRFSE